MNIKETFYSTFKNALLFLKAFGYWLALGVAVGAVCGLVGALFAHTLSLAAGLRGDFNWLILLLPLGGFLTVLIYRLCNVGGVGTNQVFESARSEKGVPLSLAPAIFLGTALTHLLGGSAGREGAALQLGGSVAALFSKIFRLRHNSRHILTICGMGALFSALFGTPLGACVFALEVVRVGQICSAALFPALVSSLTAYGIASSLGVSGEHFTLEVVPAFGLNILWRVAVIAIIGAAISIIFCKTMHLSAKVFKRLFKNEYLRIAVGGTLIILLTLAVGNQDYNGGGIHVITRIFEQGEVNYFAFPLKILFTAITIGSGFKGGEIVPTLFIGATLGGALGVLLGLSPAFGAAVGVAALFCGVTNCPFATLFLCAELFGAKGLLFFALSCFISFILSGYESLYTGQKLMFSKLNEDIME